jgi:membrane protein implicated in regulation of membrane protease activity
MHKFHIETRGPRSWLARIGFALTLILAILAGIALSAVLFAVIAVLALVGGVWFWWQTRHLRKQMREQQEEILDAEYEVIDDHPTQNRSGPRPRIPKQP